MILFSNGRCLLCITRIKNSVKMGGRVMSVILSSLSNGHLVYMVYRGGKHMTRPTFFFHKIFLPPGKFRSEKSFTTAVPNSTRDTSIVR